MAALKDFAFATVMDVYGFADEDREARETKMAAFDPNKEDLKQDTDYDFLLDSLTISNITQEGPQKEARGGIHGRPIIRHKKTVRLEMEDVVARIDTLEHFFGATIDKDENTFSLTDKFPDGIGLIGKTYVVDRDTGKRQWVQIKFNEFLPDGIFDITMEAEGDLGMISIAGELFPNDCGEYFTVKHIDGECADEAVEESTTP